MNRHLGKFLTIAALLAIPLSTLRARAQNNLRLELDGPFAICETANNLEIWVPDLHGTHYVPGFRSAFREYPLDYSGNYSSLDMRDLVPTGGGKKMILVPKDPTAPPHKSAIYMEYQVGGCQGTPVVKFTVPIPDEILPEAPADEIEQVKDGAGTTYPGHWGSGGGKYVSRIVLKYKSVDLNTAKIYGGPGGPWDLDVAMQGDDAKITLEVVPIAQLNPDLSHQQSAIAFRQMSAMALAGVERNLCFKKVNTFQCYPDSKKTSSKPGKTGEKPKHAARKNLAVTSSTAKDCHAPLFLVCNEKSSPACQP